MPHRLGLKFDDRFELGRELGRGEMGEVMLARDLFHERDVAIKIARHHLMETPETGARFQRLWLNETRLAGQFRHPFIVGMYESGTCEEGGYLVMEYVPGGTLQPFTSPETLLPVNEVIELVFKICSALEYAHGFGLLHRDVKPANILLTEDRVPKVADFGTCYVEDSEITQVFDVGTLSFMPPEHFQEVSASVQSDIYAVGVTLYQLFSGALPFRPGSYDDIVRQKVKDESIPLASRCPALAVSLLAIVCRAMHHERSQRYASWQDLRDDLVAALPATGRSPEVESECARFSTMKAMPFFEGFSDLDLWEVMGFARWRDVDAGRQLCREGEEGRAIFILARGEAEESREGQRLAGLTAGSCVGEAAYVDEGLHLRSASVTATSPMLVIYLDADALRGASAEVQAAFARAFLWVMLGRLKKMGRGD